MFKSVDIFEARKEGYKTYRVPGITVSKNNVVLATAESRPISGGDWDFNDVIVFMEICVLNFVMILILLM